MASKTDKRRRQIDELELKQDDLNVRREAISNHIENYGLDDALLAERNQIRAKLYMIGRKLNNLDVHKKAHGSSIGTHSIMKP